MKKILIIIGICALFITMPSINAIQILEKQTSITKSDNNLLKPPVPGYDGTFIGGLGRLYNQNGEWQFDYYAYLAGVYSLGVFKKLSGYIYNLEEEQIGYIYAFFGYKLIIGVIRDMENHRVPIIGFLLWNDVHFAGRIMSMFGPATHIIGKYTPNT